MNAWGITDQGKVRTQNQDAFFLHVSHESTQAVLAVCDGMGGARAGNVASELALEIFVEEVRRDLRASPDEQEMERMLAQAVEEANARVFARAQSSEAYAGMGTTLVGAILSGRQAAVVNIGDSRAYRVGTHGVSRVTRDHSLVEALIDKGDLTFEQARSHPSKNLITRALGTEPRVDCDLYTLDLAPGEYLLLCSDGLTNVVEDREILAEVLREGELSQRCRRLIELANDRGGPDNITVVVAQV
ncbi:MAG: Stp1/IreP family PP2C-type Ser/Thr phosphatase [Oscillospiraceae bacterium]|jgi:protein phosphatase|nr:Stp1/IreP family PP2C-type Ser/Thr phosphatase [Oscillospiraceae bacterium]